MAEDDVEGMSKAKEGDVFGVVVTAFGDEGGVLREGVLFVSLGGEGEGGLPVEGKRRGGIFSRGVAISASSSSSSS